MEIYMNKKMSWLWRKKACFFIHQGCFIYQVMLADDWFLAWGSFLWTENEKLLDMKTVIAGCKKNIRVRSLQKL